MVGVVKSPSRWRISSAFGWRTHPIKGGKSFHSGIDIACPSGTPITSAMEGVVTHKQWMRGYGNVVFVKHPNGYETRYAHMRNFANIQPGMQVNEGQVLGYVGSTGDSTGPHLHFETRVLGMPLNPEKVLGKNFVLNAQDFLTQPGQYAPWAPAEEIRNDPEKLDVFKKKEKLPKPNWFQRNMPYPIGWSNEQLEQYDMQQELEREVFRGVTVGELKEQGLDDKTISRLQEMGDARTNAFLAGHSKANITLGEIERDVGTQAGKAVLNALKNDGNVA